MDEEINKRFEDLEKRINILEMKKEILHNSGIQKKKSVKEFILEKSPKDGVQSAACIAYYLENFENKEVLTSKDIQKCFKDAKLKTPTNVPDKVQKAIGRGWIAKGDKKGEFYLTSTGEKIVKANFEVKK